MPTREDTPRVSIATLRAQFKPAAYRILASVQLEHGGVACKVALTTIPAHGSVKAPQRRMVCPRCERAVLVLGVVEGLGWVCARCGRWRSRDRSRSVAGALRDDGEGSSRERVSEIADLDLAPKGTLAATRSDPLS